MERIGILIEKLQAQFDAGADAQALMLTLQMLQKELMLQNGHLKKNGKTGISVVMPGQLNLSFSQLERVEPSAPVAPQEKLVFELDPEPSDIPAAEGLSAIEEFPTFSRQPDVVIVSAKELNEVVVAEKPSLNEVLEQAPKVELASTLQQDSIKDLRKAISINDRYQFINHLFKGDETMYERSIKTINGFNILAEATFWIRRELAVKLSWRDEDVLVQQFNQLVSRRFM